MKIITTVISVIFLFISSIVCANPVSITPVYTADKSSIEIVSSTGEGQEGQLQKIFSANTFDLEQADKASYAYIKDTAVPTSRKIVFLWNLAISNNSTYKFTYLMDALKFLKPLDLADEIIAYYSKETNQENKEAIINMLSSSIYFNTPEETTSLTPQQINNIVKIQDFLKTVNKK